MNHQRRHHHCHQSLSFDDDEELYFDTRERAPATWCVSSLFADDDSDCWLSPIPTFSTFSVLEQFKSLSLWTLFTCSSCVSVSDNCWCFVSGSRSGIRSLARRLMPKTVREFVSLRREPVDWERNKVDWLRDWMRDIAASFCWTATDLTDDDDDDDEDDEAAAGVDDKDLSDDENNGRVIINSRFAFWRSSYAETSQHNHHSLQMYTLINTVTEATENTVDRFHQLRSSTETYLTAATNTAWEEGIKHVQGCILKNLTMNLRKT